jgi:AcrR family transcriptional regulator
MAAKEILCEGGWKGLTMDKLAKRAGVAKGTVYNTSKQTGHCPLS